MLKNKINTTMQELPSEIQPYEKCEKYGVDTLSDVELLAIILGSGTKGKTALELSKEILYPKIGFNSSGTIQGWNLQQLKKIKGVGRVKALQILSVVTLAKRLSKAQALEFLSFENPYSIVEYYKEDMRHLKQEQMILILLDTKGNLIGDNIIAKGTVDSLVLSCREIFMDALNKGAVNIILIHNHPSGDPTPSMEDIKTTKMVEASGKLLGVTLLDHIIIGDHKYYTYSENKITNT